MIIIFEATIDLEAAVWLVFEQCFCLLRVSLHIIDGAGLGNLRRGHEVGFWSGDTLVWTETDQLGFIEVDLRVGRRCLKFWDTGRKRTDGICLEIKVLRLLLKHFNVLYRRWTCFDSKVFWQWVFFVCFFVFLAAITFLEEFLLDGFLFEGQWGHR